MHDVVFLIIFLSQKTLGDLIKIVDGEEVQPDQIIVSFLIVVLHNRDIYNHNIHTVA